MIIQRNSYAQRARFRENAWSGMTSLTSLGRRWWDIRPARHTLYHRTDSYGLDAKTTNGHLVVDIMEGLRGRCHLKLIGIRGLRVTICTSTLRFTDHADYLRALLMFGDSDTTPPTPPTPTMK